MQIEILVIGRNAEILETVIRLINNNPAWNGTGTGSDEEAIEKFHHHRYDIVLLTNGISDEEDRKIRAVFVHQQPDIIILQHYGGGSGLLSNEILGALERRDQSSGPSITFQDDVFKKE